MTWAVAVPIVVVLLGALLASMLRVEAAWGDGPARVGVRWLGIGVTFEPGRGAWRLRLLRRDVLRRERTGSDAAGTGAHGREEPDERSEGPGVGLLALLNERDAIANTAAYFFRHVTMDHLHADATIGSPDPAETGVAYGLAQSLIQPLAAASPAIRLRVEPDFMEPRLEGNLDTRFSIRTWHVVVLGLRAARLGRRLRTPGR